MVISKQDAARYLQSQGYDADVSSDGVVVVYLTIDEMTAATLRKIKKNTGRYWLQLLMGS